MSIFINIKKSYKTFLLEMCFESKTNTLALLGASGSGKSMTLKCIAGILKPDSGKIIINDKVVFDSENRINLSPQKRNIGYMPQNYALFPNMSVKENIVTGLHKFKLDKEEKEKQIKEIIDLLQLTGLENHKPHQLSGGQAQRVALARILVSRPDLLLLDEPFAALDDYLKTRLQMKSKEIIDKFNIPTILVTHNRDEAYLLADEIGIIDNGSLLIKKEKKELFKEPEFYSAALLTGCKNITNVIKEKNKLNLLDWGITIEAINKNCSYIGVRAHSFKKSDIKNGYEIQIIGISEEPFEKLVRFRFKNQNIDSEDIYWKINKKDTVSDVKYIEFDKKDILYLK